MMPEAVIKRAKEMAEVDGWIWDCLSGLERNQYYVMADQELNPPVTIQ
jgi:hypothetical protein